MPTEFLSHDEVMAMVELSANTTAKEVTTACPPCVEDFQSTHDILDWMLNEEFGRQDLVNACYWMQVSELTSSLGSVIIRTNDVAIRWGKSVLEQSLPDAMIYDTGTAIWTGLDKLLKK